MIPCACEDLPAALPDGAADITAPAPEVVGVGPELEAMAVRPSSTGPTPAVRPSVAGPHRLVLLRMLLLLLLSRSGGLRCIRIGPPDVWIPDSR